MALPGTFSVANAIDEAFERIGFDPTGLTARHINSARRSIRLLLSDWNNDSVDFWKVVSGVQVPLVYNQASFTPVEGCIDILRIACRRDRYDTPMLIIAASDWFAIPDKTQDIGMPTRLWNERLVNTQIGHIWPFSENDTDILIYDAMVRFQDSTILAAGADVPDEWLEAFTAGLAAKLAEKFAPQRLEEKMKLYGGPMPDGGLSNKGAYGRARVGNRERTDTVMVVHKGRRWRR